MGGVVFYVNAFLEPLFLNVGSAKVAQLLTVAADIVTGVIAYVVFGLMLCRQEMKEMASSLRGHA
jgi:hypothetical protein